MNVPVPTLVRAVLLELPSVMIPPKVEVPSDESIVSVESTLPAAEFVTVTLAAASVAPLANPERV